VTFYSVTLTRTIWLPDDGPRTETCRSVLMCKFYQFYTCAVVGIIIELIDLLSIIDSRSNNLRE